MLCDTTLPCEKASDKVQHSQKNVFQNRSFHTNTKRSSSCSRPSSPPIQKRGVTISAHQSLLMLQEKGVPVTACASSDGICLAVTIDRAHLSPCFLLSSDQDPDSPVNSIPFNYRADPSSAIEQASNYLQVRPSSIPSLDKIARALLDIFYEKEASCLSTLLYKNKNGQLEVGKANFAFDDAAYRSGHRHEDIQQLRDTANEVPEEAEAEKHGIVYIKYLSPPLPTVPLTKPPNQTPRPRHNRHSRSCPSPNLT